MQEAKCIGLFESTAVLLELASETVICAVIFSVVTYNEQCALAALQCEVC